MIHNERSKYPWYPYIINIMGGHRGTTQREENAVKAAFEAADPETRRIVEAVCIRRTKNIRAAAAENYISYKTAFRRIHAFRLEVARNLGLLEK